MTIAMIEEQGNQIKRLTAILIEHENFRKAFQKRDIKNAPILSALGVIGIVGGLAAHYGQNNPSVYKIVISLVAVLAGTICLKHAFEKALLHYRPQERLRVQLETLTIRVTESERRIEDLEKKLDERKQITCNFKLKNSQSPAVARTPDGP